MSMLRSIADELVSLFVDDGSLVVLVLIWLTVCWLLLPKLSLPSPLLPVLLFVGLVAILTEKALSGEQVSADVVLFCGLGNHVDLGGLPGGAARSQTAMLLAMPWGNRCHSGGPARATSRPLQ